MIRGVHHIDLGGKFYEKEWSMDIHLTRRTNRTKADDICHICLFDWYIIKFFSDDVIAVKQIILSQTQKILRRYKKPVDVQISAMPYLENQTLNGNEMIRNKFRFSDSQKILRVKKPDTIFVQGYGSGPAEQLRR
jgi:hypothetical protein